jgi:hypothetical protein
MPTTHDLDKATEEESGRKYWRGGWVKLIYNTTIFILLIVLVISFFLDLAIVLAWVTK